MGIHRGPNTVKDGLVFGYDTGYGVADNSTATRFYPGEATTNFVTTNLETLGTDGSGQSSIGTRTTIAPNHVRIVDVASNTRQSHLISGLTASTIYTVSIQFKKITGTPTFRFQLQGYSGSSYVNTIKFTSTAETGLEDIEGWQTAEWTFTLPSNCNALRIWWQDGADYTTYTHSFELKNPQLEAKSHVTPYVSGTRSSTASLIDLKRTASIDVSNVSFDSTGQPIFDGSNDKIVVPNQTSTSSYTYETVVKISNSDSSYSGFGSNFKSDSSGYSGVGNGWVVRLDPNGGLQVYTKNNSTTLLNPINISGFRAANVNKYIHLVYTYSNGTNKLYLNGVLQATGTGLSGTTPSDSTLIIGAYSWGISSQTYYINAHQPIAKLYNQTYTATEIKQNYNAYKNRFNL